MKYWFALLEVKPGGEKELAAIEKANGKLPQTTVLIGPNGSKFYMFEKPVEGPDMETTIVSPHITIHCDDLEKLIPIDILMEAERQAREQNFNKYNCASDGQHRTQTKKKP